MVCFNDIGLFNGEGRLYGDNYSGNHIAVFECDLKVPPTLSLIDSDNEEFFNQYRINVNKFKIVDVDNFMRGNTYFTKVEDENIWQKRVDEVFPKEIPQYKEKELKEIPHYERDVLGPEFERYLNQLQMLDTKSN